MRKIYISKKTMILSDILLFILCILSAVCLFIFDLEAIVYATGFIFLIVILVYNHRLNKRKDTQL